MKDTDEVNVVEVYDTELGWIEVVDPERVRIGTRTVRELREHDVDLSILSRPHGGDYSRRKFPEHTLKVKSLKANHAH